MALMFANLNKLMTITFVRILTYSKFGKRKFKDLQERNTQ